LFYDILYFARNQFEPPPMAENVVLHRVNF